MLNIFSSPRTVSNLSWRWFLHAFSEKYSWLVALTILEAHSLGSVKLNTNFEAWADELRTRLDRGSMQRSKESFGNKWYPEDFGRLIDIHAEGHEREAKNKQLTLYATMMNKTRHLTTNSKQVKMTEINATNPQPILANWILAGLWFPWGYSKYPNFGRPRVEEVLER